MAKNSHEKQEWSSRWAFIFAAISSAVGLGNVWRFPFTAHDNGGGAFIIPYFVGLLVMGVPLMMLEFTYGSKFKGASPLALARVSKKWEFLGWLPTLAAAMIIFYYGVILVWAMRFAIIAANQGCGQDTEAFFNNEFLRNSGHALQFNSIIWPMLIGSIILWGASYLVLSRGIKKGLERVNKIILPLMFVFAMILVARGVTLDNAAIGLNSLFTPDFGRLGDPSVWLAAFGQAMFSLSLCMGIMITYSSYMKKGTEMVNTTYMIAIVDVLFAFLFSVGIFAIIGYMAGVAGTAVGDVGGGAGLVFITLPIALNYMGTMGIVVGVGFFAMLAITGWTSFLSLLEAFVAPFTEKFGWSRKKAYTIVMSIGFVVSLIYVTEAANPVLGLVDWTINNIWLPLVGILQAVLAAWIVKRLPDFQAYINTNTLPYFKSGRLWIISLKYVVPVFVSGVLILAVWRALTGEIPLLAARSTPELLAFVGGTSAIIVVLTVIFIRLPWSVSVENFDEG